MKKDITFPAGIYLLKVNNRNIRNMFKVNNKDTRTLPLFKLK